MAVQPKADPDLFWESLLNPSKTLKRKKKSKKDKDIKKTKPTEEGGKNKKVKKRKKSKSEIKEKKLKRAIVGLQDVALASTGNSSNKAVIIEWMKQGEENRTQPCVPEEDPHQKRPFDERISALAKTPKKRNKKRKKVEFDLSPKYLPAKHLRPAKCCPTPTPVEDPRRRETEDGPLTQGSQSRAADDSQSIDEANSEDLFITQKTFNVPSSEASGSDVSEDASGSAVQLSGLTQLPGEPNLMLIPSQPARTTSEAATQTQNFFTELRTHLSFQRLAGTSAQRADLRPVDLSLPSRARAQPSPHPLVTTVKGKGQKVSRAPGSRSSDMTSSEDNDSLLRSRVDLTQVKAVQMRLNESFFFKMKGEGRSPRPQSQLMKLKQSREKKPRRQ